MQNTKIPVYIISDKSGIARSTLIEPLFASDIFDTLSPNIGNSGIIAPQTISTEAEYEWYKVNYCLKDARLKYSKSHVVIIKDSSTANTVQEVIAAMILQETERQDYDVNYLCKWMDRCNLYTNKESAVAPGIVPNTNFVVRTQSPNGIQALLFSPQGRDRILGLIPMKNGKTFSVKMPLSIQLRDDILAGNLVANAMVPNLFNFNMFEAASNEDYLKSAECQVPNGGSGGGGSSNSGGQTSNYIWFVIAVIVIILIAWALVQLGKW